MAAGTSKVKVNVVVGKLPVGATLPRSSLFALPGAPHTILTGGAAGSNDEPVRVTFMPTGPLAADALSVAWG